MTKKTVAGLFLLFFCVSAAFGFLRHSWINSTITTANENVAALAQKFAKDPSALKGFLEQHAEAIYVAGVWSPTEFKSGYVNQDNLDKSPPVFREFFQNVEWSSFERTLQKGANLSSSYVHAVHVYFKIPTSTGAGLDVGELKVAFLLPGVVAPGVYLGRGYALLGYFLWLLTAFWGAVYFKPLVTRSGRTFKTPLLPYLSDEEDGPTSELTWLETDTGATQPIYLDEKGRSWNVFFPVATLHHWTTKGSFYLRDHQMVVKPWGTSLVRAEVHPQKPFEFLVRALRLAGPDGFIVTFEVKHKKLYWVVGGWRNTRSELAGYPLTNRVCRLVSNRWYMLEIRTTEDSLEGLVNGERYFKLPLSDLLVDSPDVGFEKGFGVAVWNSLVKYTDIRIFTDE